MCLSWLGDFAHSIEWGLSPPSQSDSVGLSWGPELFFDNRHWMVLAQVPSDPMREALLWIMPQVPSSWSFFDHIVDYSIWFFLVFFSKAKIPHSYVIIKMNLSWNLMSGWFCEPTVREIKEGWLSYLLKRRREEVRIHQRPAGCRRESLTWNVRDLVHEETLACVCVCMSACACVLELLWREKDHKLYRFPKEMLTQNE